MGKKKKTTKGWSQLDNELFEIHRMYDHAQTVEAEEKAIRGFKKLAEMSDDNFTKENLFLINMIRNIKDTPKDSFEYEAAWEAVTWYGTWLFHGIEF